MSHSLLFFALTMTGWLNRQQHKLNDYLRQENQILREQFGGWRPRIRRVLSQ